jgi:hypothetical protein
LLSLVTLQIDFIKAMAANLAPPWRAWVGTLLAANLVAPLFFLETIEARLVLAALFAGAAIQMFIFKRKGWVRLLGLGHIPWLALVPWLVMRLDWAALDTPFSQWMAAVIALNAASLVIDIVDVIRYFAAERTSASRF